MHQGKHGHCHSATIDWVLNHRAPRPDSGHGACRCPSACRFQKVLCLALPGAPNCEPCFGVAVWPPFCVPFECSVIVSASSACGQAEGKKVLVQVLSGTAPRGTIRGRRTPFQQRLGAQMGTVFAACVADFFQTWRAKLWIFRACFWVRFSCPFLGQAY